MDENTRLKELEFLKTIFEYPLRNNAIFNLVRLKKEKMYGLLEIE